MADNRTTCRRQFTYRTRSNKFRCVRTPGGKLSTLIIKKKVSAPVCAETGVQIHGIPALRSNQVYHKDRTVSRAYGGKFCMNVVRDRILRAFLKEEQKSAKAKQQLKNAKAAKKTGKK